MMRKISVLMGVLLLAACTSQTSSKKQKEEHKGDVSSGYAFTLWVETNEIPDAAYYQNLANTLKSSSPFTFKKAIVRVTGDGAGKSSEPWYNAMNPQGNQNNPIILSLLKDLEGQNITLYALPDVEKGDAWDIYSMTDDAPSLPVATYPDVANAAGTLKQSVQWVVDINKAAAAQGITTQFTGIVFEAEGSYYPNNEDSLKAIDYYKKQIPGAANLKVGMTGAPSQGASYKQYGTDGYLNEGYLQVYNLTDNPKSDSNTYIDAMAQTASVTNPIPALPDSIYTIAWLLNPQTAAQTVWTTNSKTWKSGQPMGMQHSHDPAVNIGLLNWDFYNGGNGYAYGEKCGPTQTNCATVYFMLSTECGPNPPAGITCDCLVSGCPQSLINAFGTWSSADGVNQFLAFLDLANQDWKLQPDQFAIFQYQLLPAKWFGK